MITATVVEKKAKPVSPVTYPLVRKSIHGSGGFVAYFRKDVRAYFFPSGRFSHFGAFEELSESDPAHHSNKDPVESIRLELIAGDGTEPIVVVETQAYRYLRFREYKMVLRIECLAEGHPCDVGTWIGDPWKGPQPLPPGSKTVLELRDGELRLVSVEIVKPVEPRFPKLIGSRVWLKKHPSGDYSLDAGRTIDSSAPCTVEDLRQALAYAEEHGEG